MTREAFVEVERSSYLGYPLHITKHTITVYTPQLRFITEAASVKQARLIVRAYRRTQ
jgi:hypothetical protein